MLWIKRNLYFLIGSVVALALMGAAGWYLYSKWQLNNEIVEKLNAEYAELQRLTLLRKQHADEQYVARRSLRTLPDTIASLSQRLDYLTADRETLLAHIEDPVIIGEHPCSSGL